MAPRFASRSVCMYRSVVSIDLCPASSLMTFTGTPARASSVQNVCLSECQGCGGGRF